MNEIAEEAAEHVAKKFVMAHDKVATQSLVSKFVEIFRSHMDLFVSRKLSLN